MDFDQTWYNLEPYWFSRSKVKVTGSNFYAKGYATLCVALVSIVSCALHLISTFYFPPISFLGWNPTQFSAEPSTSTDGKFQCLFLSNTFRHPSGQNHVVDYYYFDSAPCKPSKKDKSYFVCETARPSSYDQNIRSDEKGN
jgi:hypothetical protein